MASPIPNILTGFRLACAPVVLVACYLAIRDWNWAGIAFIAFAAAAVTDLFDGMIARALNAHTAWGVKWDPIADKVLIASALIGLAIAGTINGLALIPAAIIIARDGVVSWLRTTRTVKVSWLAKVKTAVEMLAVTLLLLGPALVAWLMNAPERVFYALFSGQYAMLAEGLLWLAAALSVITALDYLRAKPAAA
jgi:cardiolipin synthase (CMP-forming)